ncbi:MAG: aminopeptidase N [Deltaproteobacteria bacterium]|nr:aminopeptidase N [Candidatus Anaeroferrophillus wilburensis]MBN2888411.1 aminopeptidase N [Deltaproteobacteria bacterium]
MNSNEPKTIHRHDYQPPPFLIDQVELLFDLNEERTVVTSRLAIRRNHTVGSPATKPLVLAGRQLILRSLSLDGRQLFETDYQVDGESLTITEVPAAFRLEIITEINPKANTALEGLYLSSGNFCTQCEAQGFRKITYFLDRPDVLARYRTTIIADRQRYPVLLANGNLVAQDNRPNDRHEATWEDPFPKPCYLFALVAGNLVQIADRFTTASGRQVALHIYVEQQNRDKCDHAMSALKKAMRWDEETYGLEYDLDCYMIVAVDDFNMGAMENKGLNIFNSRYVLARPDTATDADFQGVEGVIAHEYFHNWTGNRVTCRDWFQLSLKEGLTVFRDQEFSAATMGRAVKRIEDVRLLRSSQFPEDRGPLAHPVRPDSYVEINNFYTTTVYNKGAEVIRMLQTLIGAGAFRRGLNLYLERHDGQAATIEDFIEAMAEVSGRDFSQFCRWYSQAGTPLLAVETCHDPRQQTFTLTLRQSCPSTPGQEQKLPFHLPVVVGLLDAEGREISLQLAGEAMPAGGSRVLELREAEETFQFMGVAELPVLSCLRGFSAPVILKIDYADENLAFLLAHDGDDFNRWEAGQQLAVRIMLGLLAERRAGHQLSIPSVFSEALRQVLVQREIDPALRALALTLPTETYVGEQLEVIDPLAIHEVREFMAHSLATVLRDDLLVVYEHNTDPGPYSPEPEAIGRRSLKNVCLGYLMKLADPTSQDLGLRQFHLGANMTDVLAALNGLANSDHPQRQATLDAFYRQWSAEPLVLDKWFAVQAAAGRPDTLTTVEQLLEHPAFTWQNPNRVRALIGTFCHGNPASFHEAGGAGYGFLADQVLMLNGSNPQIAARLLTAMTRWRRYDEARQELMCGQLERIAAADGLSRDVYEIAAKSLA